MASHVAQQKAKEKKAGEPEKPGSLVDPAAQEKILRPDPATHELFGKTIALHPLPARSSLQFVGFAARVFGASQESAGSIPAMRIGGVLAEKYAEDFLRYVARASMPTSSQVSESQIVLLAADMAAKLDASSFIPLARIFLAMTAQNKTLESLGLIGTDSKNS